MVITWSRLWRELLGQAAQPDAPRDVTFDELQTTAAMCAAMGAPFVLTPRTDRALRARHR